MTGRKGNSEFCFPETLSWPRGTLRSRGNKNHCLRGQVISAPLYISQLKNTKKKLRKKKKTEKKSFAQRKLAHEFHSPSRSTA